MLDVILLGSVLIAFAAAAGYVELCDRTTRPGIALSPGEEAA